MAKKIESFSDEPMGGGWKRCPACEGYVKGPVTKVCPSCGHEFAFKSKSGRGNWGGLVKRRLSRRGRPVGAASGESSPHGSSLHSWRRGIRSPSTSVGSC
jgi:hypothetical protein